jgi:hypothetical protein
MIHASALQICIIFLLSKEGMKGLIRGFAAEREK